MKNNAYNPYYMFFSTLSSPIRTQIICALKEKDMCVNNLVKELGVEQSKISHSLSSLKQCNIVEVSKKGKERIYSLNKRTIIPLLNLIDEHARNCCKKNCKNCKK